MYILCLLLITSTVIVIDYLLTVNKGWFGTGHFARHVHC